VELLTRDKGRVQLDWQLVELAVEGVLEDVRLTHAREQGHDLRVLELVNIYRLVDLCQSNRHRRL